MFCDKNWHDGLFGSKTTAYEIVKVARNEGDDTLEFAFVAVTNYGDLFQRENSNFISLLLCDMHVNLAWFYL